MSHVGRKIHGSNPPPPPFPLPPRGPSVRMDKARTAWRSIRKKFVISSRFDPYLPPLRGGPKEASHGFRYPSPA